jgi:hypothetical protein
MMCCNVEVDTDWGSMWRVVYREPDGTEREVNVVATEAWTEKGRTAFLYRRFVDDRLVTENVLELATDQVLTYERLA